MEWQPIETAPKEEYLILALDSGIGLGRFVGDKWLCGFGFQLSDGNNMSALFSCNPTHWMPLPDAPK